MTTGAQAPHVRAQGLWTLAVAPEGRRALDHAVITPALLQRASSEGQRVLLDHAGPQAAAWMVDRPVAAADNPEPVTGRRPRALDDEGWRAVTGAYQDAARMCRSHGVAFAVVLDDDGLLHDALRHTPERAFDVVQRCGATEVTLPVEDLAPGGLDATDGLAFAQQLVRLGVTTLHASGGSRALPPLRFRTKADSRGDGRAALASALWLVGRVNARIFAMLPPGSDPLDALAREHGLAGVWVEATPRGAI